MALSFVARTAPVNIGVLARVFGGRLILGGTAGQIYTSDDDGVTWTARTSGTTRYLAAVAYNGSTVVIAGKNGACRVSVDNGVTWAAFGQVTFSHLRGARYLGGRFFVFGADGQLYTSVTGAAGTWANGTGLYSAQEFYDVAFDAAAGRWVAVGSGTWSYPHYSDDGSAWVQTTSGGPEYASTSVANQGGTWITGASINGMARSTDGAAWTHSASAFATAPVTRHGTRWVAAGYETPGAAIGHSDDDGVTWTQSVTRGDGKFITLASNGTHVLAVGYASGSSLSARANAPLFAVSADGVNWEIDETTTPGCQQVIADGDGFIGWTTSYSGEIGIATWYRITASGGGATGETITLPLEVSAVSTAQTLGLPLRVHAVTPVTLALPLTVGVIDAAVTGGLDGAGGWAAAPNGRWQAVVVLDGVDVSALIVGQVTVECAADAARTAQFSYLPGAVQPLGLIGRPVRIAFAQAGGANAQTIFSGVVDVPAVDLQTGVVSCACHDQAQEIWANTPREAIDALVGGRWSLAVSGEPEDSFDYLRERIQSVGASWALDALQRPRVLPWRDLPRAVTIRQADVIDGSLAVELPSREQLRTRVACRLQYRYTALRRRGIVAQFELPLSFFLPMITPTTNKPAYTFLTTAMVEGALGSVAGWELEGDIVIHHPPAGTWEVGDDAFYTISARVAPDLATGFSARFSARWEQTVTEDYTLAVVWAELESQLGGPVAEEIGATLEAEFRQPGWAADTSVAPVLPGAGSVGDGRLPWQPVGYDTGARDEALRTLLDRAWVRLWSASRSGRVRLALPCRPDLWIDTWATVYTDRIQAAGQVVGVTHTLDTAGGKATTELAIAVGMPGNAAAAHPAWSLPAPPADSYAPPARAYSFEIGAFVGGLDTSPEFDDEAMTGFITNAEGAEIEGYHYYPHKLTVRSPDLAAEDRDPLELTATAEIEVSIPTDLLEFA